MPPNPLQIALPPLKTLKAQGKKTLLNWIHVIKKLNPDRRRLLRASIVRPFYIQEVQKVFSKNDPRAVGLIQEANSKNTESLWHDLESYANLGTDSSDLELFRLPHLSPEQTWSKLDYETYVDVVRRDNPSQTLNRELVRRLLHKQLTEKAGPFVKQQKDRVKQILTAERDYWKSVRQDEDEDDQKEE